MEEKHNIRQILWNKVWKLAEDIHMNTDKSGNLTKEQEEKIEALDRFLCGSLDINRDEFPDPDYG